MNKNPDEMRKNAMRIVKIYASIAATIAFFCALDPEPLSGTILVIFADTPLLTVITFAMIVHLCLYYGEKDILKDGIITVAAISFGTVVGSLGAMVLGGLIPVLKTANNAIITFGLHYATGRAIISCMENGIAIKSLSVSQLKDLTNKYRKEGEEYGKKLSEVQKKMSKEDISALKELNKEVSRLSSELKHELTKEDKDEQQIESLTKKINEHGERISLLYKKYGFDFD